MQHRGIGAALSAAGLAVVIGTGMSAAQAQTTTAPPSQSGDTSVPSVIKPPMAIDPGIQAKPPIPAGKLPTPVIKPPGTAGGDPTVLPK